MKQFVIGALLALGIGHAVCAQTTYVLNDRDLRAQYCAVVTSDKIEMINRLLANSATEATIRDRMVSTRAVAADNLRRLLTYLEPASSRAEFAGALLGATQRAQEDLASAKSVPACPFDQSFAACADQQGRDYPAVARVRDCSDLSWLPY
jgi:hypothetical protein